MTQEIEIQAYAEGARAYADGLKRTDNPYRCQSDKVCESRQWHDGWDESRHEWADDPDGDAGDAEDDGARRTDEDDAAQDDGDEY